MTADITPAVIAWLKSGSSLSSLVNGHIGAVVYTEDEWPAIQVGQVTGAPRSDATAAVDTIFDWQVALYIHGGRRISGRSDLPDHRKVSQVAAALLELIKDNQPWADSNIEIVRAQVVTTATGIDPDTLGARMTVTLALTTVPA